MPNISTARGIARNLGADLSKTRLQALHRQLTQYMRTSAGGAINKVATWGNVTGTLSAQTDLQTELDQARTMRFFLGE